MNLSSVAIITVGSLYIGLGLTVIARNLQKSENRIFLAIALSAAIWTFTNLPPLGPSTIEYAICLISYAAAALLTSLLLQFILLLTRRKISSPLLAVELILSLASAIPGVVATRVTNTAILTTPLIYPYGLLLAGNLLAAALLLGLYMRSAKGVARTRAGVIIVGFLSSAVGGIFFNLVLPLFGASYQFTAVGPVFSVFLLISIAFSIINHRLFEIKLTVLRTLAYIVLLLGLGATYSWLIIGTGTSVLQSVGFGSYISLFQIIATLLIAMSFRYIKQWFDKLTNALFFQDSYDTKAVLDTLVSVLVKTVSLSALCRQSLKVIADATKPRFIIILIEGQTNASHTFQIGQTNFELSDMHPLVAKTNPRPLFITDEMDEGVTELVASLSKHGIALVARLRTTSLTIGYMIVGDKANGSAFSDQDINLVRIAADELSVAIQNSLRFEEIGRFNDRLQQEIAEATKKLRGTNKKLRALDIAKDEFISIASHQLRTPLTSVKGHLSMLLEGDAGPLKPQQQELAKDTFISAERMAFLITDLLNISRLKDGKLSVELAQANLPQMIREEIDQFTIPIKARNLIVRAQIPSNFPTTVRLDIGKIRQVIMNFIDNAIYYSKPGGKIIVSLAELNKQLVLTVQDNGIGIPTNEQTHIFSKFFRASNARYVRPDGTGIGLFAASKIIAAHGGTMIFESKENRGSTFGFKLPLQ
ncbi:MAG TPA: HAMP domain-containing sensor histidine kinase [Candidatus Acidoferrum sp.]|nr:HAMP domain-containing sensor histidine kinase [Candidatus Acidoferrum sp.]